MTEREHSSRLAQRSLRHPQSRTIWAPAFAGVSGRERDLTINPPLHATDLPIRWGFKGQR